MNLKHHLSIKEVATETIYYTVQKVKEDKFQNKGLKFSTKQFFRNREKQLGDFVILR